MSETLKDNPISQDLEIIYTGVIQIGAVAAPSVGGVTTVQGTLDTGITQTSGFIILGSLQYSDGTTVYQMPHIETMSSGGDGGEIKWQTYLLADVIDPNRTLVIYATISNYLSTLNLAASTATIQVLRARGVGAQ